MPASTLKLEEKEFVVDFGASMHMISKKDLSEAEMDTLTKWCSPTIVITANGEVQTQEEAIVYVKELDMFLTMKVFENMPAVLSLGKLCDENGYSYEWINGQKPHLIKDGIRIICNTENFVAFVVPDLSSSSSGSSSTPRTRMKQESHSSSPSSPTVGEISVRVREDASNSDTSPVPVSNLVDDTLDDWLPDTGYEPNVMEFTDVMEFTGTTELNNTASSDINFQDSFDYTAPSSELYIDDDELGKLLAEVHRDYANYRRAEGVNVSPSSVSVMVDRTGEPVEERIVEKRESSNA